MNRHQFTKPVDTEPPLVAIVVVHRRPFDGELMQQLVDSIKGQSYSNIELLAMHHTDLAQSAGLLRNQVVRQTEAQLVLFMAEEDMLVVDYVASMVALYQHAKATDMHQLIHITSGITGLLPNGHMAPVNNLVAPGMYQRQFLLDVPFDNDLDHRVDEMQRVKLADRARAEGKPVTFATTHHFGYILRIMPFRSDGISINA